MNRFLNKGFASIGNNESLFFSSVSVPAKVRESFHSIFDLMDLLHYAIVNRGRS